MTERFWNTGLREPWATADLFSIDELWVAARNGARNRLVVAEGAVDWDLTDYRRVEMYTLDGERAPTRHLAKRYRKRSLAHGHFLGRSAPTVVTIWEQEDTPPETPLELVMVAEAYAEEGSDLALPVIEKTQAVSTQ